jgi:FdhD protein
VSSKKVPAVRYEAGQPAPREEELALEEPLEIRVAGDTLAITMRTPGHDRDLALGWLLAEGVIRDKSDVSAIAHCGRPDDEGFGNTLEITPAPGTKLELDDIVKRGTLTSAACGVCGRRSIDDLLARVGPVDDETRLASEVVQRTTQKLAAQQPVFARTGGLHAALALDSAGNVLAAREDVGRHNAVDKVVGRLLLEDLLETKGRILVVSGRTSFEIVQKAISARFVAVVGVSAPSSLAVETAMRARLLLVGFARDERFTVYSGEERLSPNPA